MKAKEMMHKDPACCTPNMSIQDVARLMIGCDCGSIPVVEHSNKRRLVGVMTDRDIVVRAVADGMIPAEARVGDYMSSAVASVTPEASLDQCLELMRQHQVRRLPVVDANGDCIGVVTQAQVSRYASARQAARLLKEVSQRRVQVPAGVGADF